LTYSKVSASASAVGVDCSAEKAVDGFAAIPKEGGLATSDDGTKAVVATAEERAMMEAVENFIVSLTLQ